MSFYEGKRKKGKRKDLEKSQGIGNVFKFFADLKATNNGNAFESAMQEIYHPITLKLGNLISKIEELKLNHKREIKVIYIARIS